LRGVHRLLRRARDAPGRDCNAVVGKQLLRLVFVEIHVGSVRGKTGRPRAGPRAAVAAGCGQPKDTGGPAILSQAGAAGKTGPWPGGGRPPNQPFSRLRGKGWTA